MSCRLDFHLNPPPADTWWNGREWIGLCPRCRRFVYRETLHGWQTVPKTMNIVWRPRAGARTMHAFAAADDAAIAMPSAIGALARIATRDAATPPAGAIAMPPPDEGSAPPPGTTFLA